MGEGTDLCEGAGESAKGCSAENGEGTEEKDDESEGVDAFGVPCVPRSRSTLMRSGYSTGTLETTGTAC